MSKNQPTNQEIADVLERIAELLEAQDANPHRVRAYRSGARRARGMERSLAEMVRSGDGQALQELPDIGERLARAIASYVHTGRSQLLDRLQGEVSPEKLFAQLPGIGKNLAERITKQLDVSTLEELEQAAHDGRLAQVEGFGPKRVRNVQVSLAGMLSRAAQRRARQRAGDGKGRKYRRDGPVLGPCWTLGLHRPVFQHCSSPRAGKDRRLGGDLLRARQPGGSG